MSDLSPKQIAELIYQYERVLTQIDRGSLMLSPRLLKRVKDTITALAQVKELEAALKEIARNPYYPPYKLVNIARAALQENEL